MKNLLVYKKSAYSEKMLALLICCGVAPVVHDKSACHFCSSSGFLDVSALLTDPRQSF